MSLSRDIERRVWGSTGSASLLVLLPRPSTGASAVVALGSELLAAEVVELLAGMAEKVVELLAGMAVEVAVDVVATSSWFFRFGWLSRYRILCGT